MSARVPQVAEPFFSRVAPVIELVVRGKIIGTTAEHPFYVVERQDFVAAGEIEVGETFVSHDGQLVKLEAIRDTGKVANVYNFRIADFHTYFVGGKDWGFSVWVHNANYRKLIDTSSEVPSRRNGAFDSWFDSLSARTVKRLYNNDDVRDAIENRLRGDGGLHEYLMVSMAPVWKKWGVTVSEFRKMTTSISDLNNGIAKGWVHSTGGLTEALNSKRVHNQLQKLLQRSNTLEEFKKNLIPWSRKWLNGGTGALPEGLRG